MELKLYFSDKEVSDFLTSKGYNISNAFVYNSNYDDKYSDKSEMYINIKVAYKNDANFNLCDGSRKILSEYGLEAQFVKEIKLKLLN